jgi:hypothetical protein
MIEFDIIFNFSVLQKWIDCRNLFLHRNTEGETDKGKRDNYIHFDKGKAFVS